jgi:hypothetical protein
MTTSNQTDEVQALKDHGQAGRLLPVTGSYATWRVSIWDVGIFLLLDVGVALTLIGVARTVPALAVVGGVAAGLAGVGLLAGLVKAAFGKDTHVG